MIESLESENNQLQERIRELEQIQATALEVGADEAGALEAGEFDDRSFESRE